MVSRLKKMIPDQEQIVNNRWLAWLGPNLLHPRLWHFSRRGVALGAAVGVFFGFLIPIAQIPAAAAIAVLLRAYIPAAVGSTLVTNPVTFAPVYVFAHQLGCLLLGVEEGPPAPTDLTTGFPASEELSWWESTSQSIASLGKPLLVGLSTLAVTGSLSTYALIMLIWRIKTARAWSRRRL